MERLINRHMESFKIDEKTAYNRYINNDKLNSNYIVPKTYFNIKVIEITGIDY